MQPPTTDEAFAQLRSLLQRPASPQLWSLICEQLDAWQEPELSQLALPYAAGILARWPKEVAREAPSRWTDALMWGKDEPRHSLCDGLLIQTFGAQAATSTTHLVRSPRLSQLRSFKCWHPPLYEQDLTRLGQAPWLGQLEVLDLSSQPHGDLCAQFIAYHTKLSKLEQLSLNSTTLTARGLQALSGASHLSTLRALDLSNNTLNAAALEALPRQPAWSTLEALHLNGVSLTDDGLALLLRHLRTANLKRLALSNNRLSPASIDMLAQCEALKNLEVLELKANGFEPDRLDLLSLSPYLSAQAILSAR